MFFAAKAQPSRRFVSSLRRAAALVDSIVGAG
jgi:hypothetical protein